MKQWDYEAQNETPAKPNYYDAVGANPYLDIDATRNLTNRLNTLTTVAPGLAQLDPSVLTTMATDFGLRWDELVAAGAETELLVRLDGYRAQLEATLEGTDFDDRPAIWEALPPAYRETMLAMGMQAPATEEAPGGVNIPLTSWAMRPLTNLLGITEGDGNYQIAGGTDTGLGGAVAKGLDVTGHILSAPFALGERALGEGIDSLEWLSDNSNNRVARTAALASDEQGGRQSVVALFSSMFTGDLVRHWREAGRLEGRFLPSARAEALERAGGDVSKLTLAMEVAEGASLVEAVTELTGAKPGTPEHAKAYGEALTWTAEDDAFRTMVSTLARGSTGFGPSLARGVGADPLSGQGRWLNTFGGLLFEVVTDPTLLGGKGLRGYRLATTGLDARQFGAELSRLRSLSRLALDIDEGRLAAGTDDVARRVREANAEVASGLGRSTWARTFITESRQVESGRTFNRGAQRLLDALDPEKGYTYRDLLRDAPQYQPVLKAVRQHHFDEVAAGRPGLRTVDDLWDFFTTTEEGYARLFSRFTGWDNRIVRQPGITRTQEAWLNRKRWWAQKLDNWELTEEMRRDLGVALTDRFLANEIGVDALGVARKMADDRPLSGRLRASIVGGLRKATQHIVRTDGYIRFQAAGADDTELIAEFNRFLEYGALVDLPEASKARYLELWIDGNDAQRFALTKLFVAEVLGRSGVLDSSDEAATMLDQYAMAGDELYALDELTDGLDAASIRRSAQAVFDSETSAHVAIPRFQELLSAVAKHQTFQWVAGDHVGRLDAVLNRFWKPLLLFRVGFITRAAGEEGLGFILRHGVTPYVRARLGAQWSVQRTYDSVKGTYVHHRDLSPWMGAVRNRARTLQSWAGATEPQLARRAQRLMAGENQRELQRITKLNRLGRAGDAEAAEEAARLFEPWLAKARGELRWTSRRVDEMARFAQQLAVQASPVFWDLSRLIHLPSRRAVASALMGINVTDVGKGVTATARWRPYKMGPRLANVDLVESYSDLLTNPRVANAFLAKVGGTRLLPYGKGDTPDAFEGFSLSQPFVAAQRDQLGAVAYLDMVPMQAEWGVSATGDADLLERYGEAVGRALHDESVRASGAAAAIMAYVGPETLVELELLLGDDALRRLATLRAELAALPPESPTLASVRELVAANGLDDLFDDALEWTDIGDDLSPEARDALAEFVKNDASPRARALLEPHRSVIGEPLRTDWTEVEDLVRQRIASHLRTPGYQPTNQAMQKATQLLGKPIARPLANDQVRLYTVLVPRGQAEALARINELPGLADALGEALLIALEARRLPADQIDAVLRLVSQQYEGGTWINLVLGQTPPAAVAESHVYGSPFMFADPAVAEEFRGALDEVLAAVVPSTSQGDLGLELTTLGHLDVPVNQLRTGAAQMRPVAGGPYKGRWERSHIWLNSDPTTAYHAQILPDDRVRFIEVREGTSPPKWMAAEAWDELDPALRPIPTGREQWANGVTEDAALRQLGTERADQLLDLVTTRNKADRPTEALSEVLAPHLSGSYDAGYDALKVPYADLPDRVRGPVRTLKADDIRFNRVMRGWFDDVVTPAMNSIIRTPHFIHNYAAIRPMGDDFYRFLVSGRLDETVTRALADTPGWTDELGDTLVDHIHKLWEADDLADEDDAWSAVVHALREGDDEAVVNALIDVIEAADAPLRTYDELLEAAIADYRRTHGVDPEPSEWETLVSLGQVRKFHPDFDEDFGRISADVPVDAHGLHLAIEERVRMHLDASDDVLEVLTEGQIDALVNELVTNGGHLGSDLDTWITERYVDAIREVEYRNAALAYPKDLYEDLVAKLEHFRATNDRTPGAELLAEWMASAENILLDRQRAARQLDPEVDDFFVRWEGVELQLQRLRDDLLDPRHKVDPLIGPSDPRQVDLQRRVQEHAERQAAAISVQESLVDRVRLSFPSRLDFAPVPPTPRQAELYATHQLSGELDQLVTESFARALRHELGVINAVGNPYDLGLAPHQWLSFWQQADMGPRRRALQDDLAATYPDRVRDGHIRGWLVPDDIYAGGYYEDPPLLVLATGRTNARLHLDPGVARGQGIEIEVPLANVIAPGNPSYHEVFITTNGVDVTFHDLPDDLSTLFDDWVEARRELNDATAAKERAAHDLAREAQLDLTEALPFGRKQARYDEWLAEQPDIPVGWARVESEQHDTIMVREPNMVLRPDAPPKPELAGLPEGLTSDDWMISEIFDQMYDGRSPELIKAWLQRQFDNDVIDEDRFEKLEWVVDSQEEYGRAMQQWAADAFIEEPGGASVPFVAPMDSTTEAAELRTYLRLFGHANTMYRRELGVLVAAGQLEPWVVKDLEAWFKGTFPWPKAALNEVENNPAARAIVQKWANVVADEDGKVLVIRKHAFGPQWIEPVPGHLANASVNPSWLEDYHWGSSSFYWAKIDASAIVAFGARNHEAEVFFRAPAENRIHWHFGRATDEGADTVRAVREVEATVNYDLNLDRYRSFLDVTTLEADTGQLAIDVREALGLVIAPRTLSPTEARRVQVEVNKVLKRLRDTRTIHAEAWAKAKANLFTPDAERLTPVAAHFGNDILRRNANRVQGVADESESFRRWIEKVDANPSSLFPAEGYTTRNQLEAMVARRKERMRQKGTWNEVERARLAGAVGPLRRWAGTRYQANQRVQASLAEKAADMTVQFIDDHRFRSQYQETVRTLMPFWFAEEQFLKRMARMVASSPESIRRASIYMEGLRHTGIVQTDENGQEILVYPTTGIVNERIAGLVGMVTGVPAFGVISDPSSGNVNFLLPGWNNRPTGELSFGPWMGISLATMSSIFPEIAAAEDAWHGDDRAVGRNPLEYVIPTGLQRLLGAAAPSLFSSERMASATMRALQALEAAGLTPPELEQASASERQAYVDRVGNTARILNVIDALLYFGSPLPTGASIAYGDLELDREFSEIVFQSGLPDGEGFAAFAELYPDAHAYSVFQTEGGSPSAAVAYTEESLAWLDRNEAFVTKHPRVSAYLMPQRSIDDEYSRRAFQTMLAAGLRERRTPEEYLDQLYVARDIGEWVDVTVAAQREAFLLAEAGHTDEAKALEQELDEWKRSYRASHPVFDAHLSEGKSAERRAAVERERDLLLTDVAAGRWAPTPDQAPIIELMDAHQRFERWMASVPSATKDGQEARKAQREHFLAWAADYVEQHPTARSYFDGVVRWDSVVGGYETSLVIQREEVYQ